MLCLPPANINFINFPTLLYWKAFKESLICQPPLPYFSVSLKPTPVRLPLPLIQWKYSYQYHASTLQNPKLHSQVSEYMTSQHTGIASYLLILETLWAWIPSHSLLLFVFFLPFLSSLQCCLLSFCWLQILEKTKWAVITSSSVDFLQEILYR